MSAHEKAVEAAEQAWCKAIAAYLAYFEKSNFGVAPIEPTEAMLDAGRLAILCAIDADERINDLVKSVHAELCDASPFVEQEGNHDRT